MYKNAYDHMYCMYMHYLIFCALYVCMYICFWCCSKKGLLKICENFVETNFVLYERLFRNLMALRHTLCYMLASHKYVHMVCTYKVLTASL